MDLELQQSDDAADKEPQGNKGDSPPPADDKGDTIVDKVEQLTDEVFHDIHNVTGSLFDNEKRAAYWWLGFVALYWTTLTWVAILLEFEFIQPGFFTWILGAVAMFAVFYTLREGKMPSGATPDNPTGTSGVGRWSTFMLCASIIIDLFLVAVFGFKGEGDIAVILRGALHFVGLLWGSLFFYNRFRKVNPDIATSAFWSEWIDILITLIVVMSVRTQQSERETCFDSVTCGAYFFFLVCTLSGWIIPMMTLNKWGVSARVVTVHLFFLDLCCDLPIVVLNLSIPENKYNYRHNAAIFIDTLWKTVLLIRSISYYAVYRFWLARGQKQAKEEKKDNKDNKEKKENESAQA